MSINKSNEFTKYTLVLHKPFRFKRDMKTGDLRVFKNNIYWGYYTSDNKFIPSVNNVWENKGEINDNEVPCVG